MKLLPTPTVYLKNQYIYAFFFKPRTVVILYNLHPAVIDPLWVGLDSFVKGTFK